MRILHIIDSAGMYGAEVMLFNLVAEQIQLGLKPVIASIGDHNCGEKSIEIEARRRNFAIELFRMIPGPNLLGARKILKYAQSINCNLLHTHGYKGNILFGFIPKRLRRFPLIATVHGWTSVDSMISRKYFYELLDKWTLSFMDAVVLVNKSMLNIGKLKKNNSKHIHIINNGISTKLPKASHTISTKYFPSDTMHIIAVGRLSPEKGFEVLLEAMEMVINNGLNVSLTIFGEGETRKVLEKQIDKLGLNENVKLAGFEENIAGNFPYFDLLVMPSLTEGLPITLLEAMRAKLPIIASKVGGIPNLLERGIGGELVKAGSVDELAGAMIKLLKSSLLRKQFAQKAHIIFKKKYSSVQMAVSYKKIYNKICNI